MCSASLVGLQFGIQHFLTLFNVLKVCTMNRLFVSLNNSSVTSNKQCNSQICNKPGHRSADFVNEHAYSMSRELNAYGEQTKIQKIETHQFTEKSYRTAYWLPNQLLLSYATRWKFRMQFSSYNMCIMFFLARRFFWRRKILIGLFSVFNFRKLARIPSTLRSRNLLSLVLRTLKRVIASDCEEQLTVRFKVRQLFAEFLALLRHRNRTTDK